MTKLSGQAITLFRNKLKRVYRKRKISNADKHIERLLKSVYPTQAHDYVMLKILNRDFPCDAPLFPIVKKLVQLGFCCQGWNAYSSDKQGDCFIGVAVKPTRRITDRNARKQLYAKLRKHFPGIRIVIRDDIVKQKVLPDSLRFEKAGPWEIYLSFKPSMIDKIASTLKVKPIGATKQVVLPGTIAAKMPDKLLRQVQNSTNPPNIEYNFE
jgi:hypothetical protein